MKKIISPKLLIFLIVFINFLGYGIVFPILPLITRNYGGNSFISGILIASFSVMQLIFMPIMGRLSDRFGRKPLLLISLWGTVASFLIMGATNSIFWLFIARIIDGASGGNLSIAQAYIADITKKKERAAGMGVITAALTLGFIFGPLWGGIFSKISLSFPFYAAALITLTSTILTHIFLSESLTKKEVIYEKKHFSLDGFIKNILKFPIFYFYIIMFFLYWAQSGFYTIITLLGADVFNLTVFKVSLLLTFGGLLSAFIQGYLVGKVVKIFPQNKVFLASSFISIVSMLIIGLSRSLFIFFIGNTIYSIGVSFLVPLLQSFVSEKASVHEQGGSMGILQSFGSGGRIIGPIFGGFLYASISPFSPAISGAVIFAVILFISIQAFAVERR